MSSSQFNPVNPPDGSEQVQNRTSRQKQQQAKQQYQNLDSEQKIRSEGRTERTSQDKVRNEARSEQEAKEKSQTQEEKEESKENLERVKELTNNMLSQLNIKLDYEEDEQLNEMIVKVMNEKTDELIRQIPPEEMLELAKRMEEMTGMLIDKWS